jgi:hypothetical protein
VTKKESFKFDAAGWLFWTVVFAVLIGPLIYLFWNVVYETTSRIVPVGMGVVGAAIGAGFISWAVNAVIQVHTRKKRLQERKKAKKRK